MIHKDWWPELTGTPYLSNTHPLGVSVLCLTLTGYGSTFLGLPVAIWLML